MALFDDEASRNILLSEISYSLDQGTNSKKSANKTMQEMIRSDRNKAFLLKDLEIVDSNKDMMAVANHKQQKLYIVARGTNFSCPRDVYNDLRIIHINNPGTRLTSLAKFYDKQAQQYKNYSHYATGHSLGGSLAENLTLIRDNIKQCQSFNAGASLFNNNNSQPCMRNREYIINVIMGKRDASFTEGYNYLNQFKITAHHVQGDPISAFKVTQNSNQINYDMGHTFLQKLILAPHSLNNFLNNISEAPKSFNHQQYLQQKEQQEQYPKGVNLNVDPQKLNNIIGVRLDSDQLNFLLSQNQKDQWININDLAVPLMVYYDDTIPQKNKQLMFSLDPIDIKNLQGPQEKVFWPDKTLNRKIIGGTEFGDVLFQADYLMKQMSLGLITNENEFKYPEELLKLGFRPSHKLGATQNSRFIARLWLELDSVDFNEQENKSGIEKLIKGIQVKVCVKAKEMNEQLQDKDVQHEIQGCYQFAKLFTKHYELIEQIYPIFSRLKQLYRAIIVAQWIWLQQIPIDIEKIKQLVNQQRKLNYSYQNPALWKTWVTKQQIGNKTTTHSLTVQGGVNLQVNLNNVKVHKEQIQDKQVLEKGGIVLVNNPFQIVVPCQDCKRELNLQELQLCLRTEPKKFYCTDHSPLQCKICYNLIIAGQKYLQLNKESLQNVHAECFTCIECGLPIENEHVIIQDQFLIHKKCSEFLQTRLMIQMHKACSYIEYDFGDIPIK
ncbi:hypothetical protein pb186bvf_015164 [Paramecium bursaria]